ncbi:MAG TPA: XrtA system polysaccharide chain length determinant [Falsiroseomonas sp.]|jgi:polysaccharide chain length determinant protein (PEP-CTERM system associated)|nr:XrtA system polysaccharide chain length determinant [Falsiroseomonas sp.]
MNQFLIQIRQYATSGWRHRWKALLLAWVVSLGGWMYVYTLPNQYSASTRIYADADVILSQLLSGIAVDSRPQGQVELLQRTLLSRPNLERVASRTGLDLRADSASARERLLTGLASNVRIQAQTRNLFTITFSDSDPRMTHAVVQALLTLFMEQATANDRLQMENARSFIGQQLASYEAQLREAEQRRAEFRARYTDLLPGDGGASGLEQARGRLTALRGELQDAAQRRDTLRQQLEATPQTLRTQLGGAGDPRILEGERQLRELLLQYTEQHPAVAAARSALADLRSGRVAPSGGAAAAGPPVPNPVYEQLRVRLLDTESAMASLDRRGREAEAQVARLEALARTVPQLQAQFAALDRDYDVIRRAYEELLQRRESVQIAGAARTGADRVRLEIVDPPIVPNEPVGPNRVLLASGVLLGGLGAGVLLAFLLVQLDRSFYTLHDLRKLGLPVIGSISSTAPRRSQVLPAAAFSFGLAVLLLAFGAVTAAGPALIARLPSLVARFLA